MTSMSFVGQSPLTVQMVAVIFVCMGFFLLMWQSAYLLPPHFIFCAGIEDFETAFMQWSDALDLASEQTETESMSSRAESTSSLPESEKVLKTLLQSAHKLRKLIHKHQLNTNLPEAVAMEPVLTWIDDRELISTEADDDDESTSDSDSFVSAAETAAQLEVRGHIDPSHK